ncbi:type 4a pilus biogenesis protein PilO [Moraxella sp. ZY200743]|uniref:type 4a pilus biogenesis protein PilO n=1 Tax=Moraxella sp. ZY200743 TaxID=2911970 RepID=UPI003D7C8B91
MSTHDNIKDKFTQTWQQLGELNWENFGTAPRWLRLLVLVILAVFVLGFGWLLLIKPITLEYQALMMAEQTLVNQYAQKYAKAQQLTVIQSQTHAMNGELSVLLEQMPSHFNMSVLTEQLHAIATRTGVQMNDIRIQREDPQDLFVERGFVMVMVGDYHQLAKMFSELTALPIIITIHDFDMGKSEQAKPTKLQMTVHAKTYRTKDNNKKDVQ